MDKREKSELGDFWFRVLAGLSRLAALGLFLAAHYGINRTLGFILPPNMGSMLLFSQDVIAVFFLLLYAYLGWDMLQVFVPQLHRLTHPVIESKGNTVESNDERDS